MPHNASGSAAALFASRLEPLSNAPELSRGGLCELLNQTAGCRQLQLLVRYSLRDTMPGHKRFHRMDAAPG
jgi:hypothetical protein